MKTKIFILGLICLFYINCAQKFDDVQAGNIIKDSFELTEKDSVEILGISMEEKDVAIVKFNLNEVQISSKMRKYDTGWQLDEIQNELGMWIPAENLTKFFSQPEKQKTAMIDITVISTAVTDFVTDNGVTPKQEGIYSEDSDFYYALSPFYLKELPIKDPWGNNYRAYCGLACNGKFGISGAASDDFIIASYGKDGEKEIWEFNATDPEGGIFVVKDVSDFDKDLIMWNGSWIRAPGTRRY